MHLKRHFFITLLLTGIVFFSKAQNVALGIKGGGTFTKIKGDSLNTQYRIGYQVGVFAELDIVDDVGIQPEILLTQSSSRVNSFAGDPVGKDINITYIAIPVMLRISLKEWLTLQAGAEFSFKIREDDSFFQNGEDAIASGNTGLVGGLQFNLKAFRIYGRYNVGLTNISDASDSKKWTSQQLQLGIGIRF